MSTDLSQWHQAIRQWPESGHSSLSEEQLASYRQNGFLAGVPILSADEVAQIRADIEEISDPGHSGKEFWYEYNSDITETGDILQGVGGWRVRRSLHDLLWHPTILGILRQLLGGPPRLLFDQLFCKPARQSGAVSWHQDYSYWTYTQPMNHATCWIALDDADLSNGCVQYVPGSHRWGLLPRPSNLTRNQASLLDVLSDEQRASFAPVPAEVPAGSAIFHHPLVIHGSLPNSSDRPRRGTTVHVMRDGTRAAVDEPSIDGVPAWLVGGEGPFYPVEDGPAGPVLEGQYFPLL